MGLSRQPVSSSLLHFGTCSFLEDLAPIPQLAFISFVVNFSAHHYAHYYSSKAIDQAGLWR